jgi:hypothetical protein
VSLTQGGRVLLPGCSNLLQLDLDFLELLRQALEDTVVGDSHKGPLNNRGKPA